MNIAAKNMIEKKLPYLRRAAYLENPVGRGCYITAPFRPTAGNRYGWIINLAWSGIFNDNHPACAFSAFYPGNGMANLSVQFTTTRDLSFATIGYDGGSYKSFQTGNTDLIPYKPFTAFFNWNGRTGTDYDSIEQDDFAWQYTMTGATPRLFTRDPNGGNLGLEKFFGRIYNVKVRMNDDIIWDIYPVLDLSGRPCMYDQTPSDVPETHHSRFFYNQGTGEFTWGEL